MGKAEERNRTNKTEDAILAGAMQALSRRGADKLSVFDICEASGVSRGTFYRYFTGKDDILNAIGQHFERGLAAALDAAIDANPDPAHRVQIVLDTIIRYRDESADFGRMLEVTPDFTLGLLRDVFPGLVKVVTDALGPAAAESPLVTSGELTKRQLGELFFRTVMSMLLFPGARTQQVSTLVSSLFRADRNEPGRQRRRRSKAG